MADPELRVLTALCRLRRMETDAARRALGEALSQETILAEREAAVAAECEAARGMVGDFDHDTFSAWFTRMRAEQTRLSEAHRDAAAQTAATQQELARTRVAETAAEDALAAATARRDAARAHAEQMVLEDVARALRQTAT